MATILTLDLGTTYFKVGLFNRQGSLCALHREASPITHPREGLWELDVRLFQESICSSIRHLAKLSPDGLKMVEAITFATQTNSFVLLDRDKSPVTPIILWPDDRAQDFDNRVRQLTQIPGFQATTGISQLGCEFMAAKLLWLQENDPATWSRANRLCLISDYLTWWLTGQHVTEAGVAGLTGAVDIHALRWWPEVCETLHLDGAMLPQVTQAGTDVGPILPAVADELGLPATCRFIIGCLDQYAGAIGAGNITPGGVSETTGTVLATVRCVDALRENASNDLFQGPGFGPGIYYQMVFGNTSANLLEWYRNQLPDRPDFELLGRFAADVPPGAEGLRVRPDANMTTVEEAFMGMQAKHTAGHATRAIMEAVAFALAEQVERLCGSQRPTLIRAGGGASRSNLWLQIKADVLNTPFVASVCPEPTSLGVAMLAARALDWGTLDEFAETWVRAQSPYTPDRDRHTFYQTLRRDSDVC